MKNILPFKSIVKQAKKLACLLSFIYLIPFSGLGQEVIVDKSISIGDVCDHVDVDIDITGDPVPRPIEAVLVIDRSGSMGTTYMNHAKDAAKQFARKFLVDEYIPGNKIAIVSYSYSATLDVSLTNSYSAVEAAINTLDSDGYTNIADGFDKAKLELETNGSFNNTVIRSIVLLTDGVANRAPSYYSCSRCSTSPTVHTCCTNAAISSGQATHTINNYNTKVFSIGLFGGISGDVQALAESTMEQAQNDGFWSTESSANLSGIYDQISNQLIWAAKTAITEEAVQTGYTLLTESITASAGTTGVNGNIITWELDYIYDEIVTLSYTLIANQGTCGAQTPSTGTLSYINSEEQETSINFTNPEVCIPCAEISSIAVEPVSDCSCVVDYSSTIDLSGNCGGNVVAYAWEFFLDGQNIGNSNSEDGTFTIPAQYCPVASNTEFRGELTISFEDDNPSCTLSRTDEATTTINYCPYENPDDWAYDCGANIDVEVIGTGTDGDASTPLFISDIGSVDKIIVEAINKGGTAPASMVFTSSLQSIAAPRLVPENGNSQHGIYRAEMDPVSSITLNTPSPTNTYSFVAYIFRNNQDQKASTGLYEGVYLYHNTKTITIPTSSVSKNLELYIPITELTNDSRIVDIHIEAGTAVFDTTYSLPNMGYSLNISPLKMYNIPGDVTEAEVTVTSPGSNGDSFLFGTIVANIECLYDIELTCPSDLNLSGCGTNVITGLPYSESKQNISLSQFTELGGSLTAGCGINEISYQDSQTGSNPIHVTRTFTVSDFCENEKTCEQTITITNNLEVTLSEYGPYCDSNDGVQLDGQPSGGTYYGTGVDEDGFFSIANAEIGSNIIKYVYLDEHGCSDSAEINIEVIRTPNVYDPADTFYCDSHILGEIQGEYLTGNEVYRTEPNGGGEVVPVGTLITETVTLYVYDETGTDPNCFDQNGFVIEIWYSPVLDTIPDQVACNSFVLPDITGEIVTDRRAYWTEPNEGGTKYEIGDVISESMTLWVFDQTGVLMENCYTQYPFNITINKSPNINDIQDQVTCDSYTLPTITGSNLSGNQAYYTETNGGGTKYLAGETINSSTILFIYDETGTTPNCSDEESFSITINNTPEIDGIPTQTACGYFIFPEITGTNLTGNESYYSEANGGGTPYNMGDTIWNNVTMYIYDETGTTPNCFDQERFDIRIDNLAQVTLDPEGPICDEYTSGISLNGQPGGGTYSGTAVTGNTFYPQNAVIGSNEVIYTVSNGTCSGADTINITVVETPDVNDKQDVANCDFYVLPEITGTNLSGNEAFFTASNGTGSSYNEGDTIWSTTRLYIYDESDTDPACGNEEDFLVTINNTPDVNDIQDQTACDSYILPDITGSNLSGNQAYYTASNGGGTMYEAGDEITSTVTLYIYDETGTTPNCSDEESFTITINNTPDITDITDKTSCDYYILPEITGSDLSGNEAFYTGINGSGDEYAEGDTIWASTNLFIYDETGTTPNCFDQESFSITIDELADVVLDPAGPACDENTDGITLNGTPSGGTYSGTAVSGNKFYPQNAVIGSNKVIYTVSNGTCSGADTINITVVETPEVDDMQDVTACDSYVLPEIEGDNLSGNEAFYSSTNGSGTSYSDGDTIWSTTRLYIYDESDTDPACGNEEDFLVTINNTPDVNDIQDQTACDSYILPDITGSNLSGNQAYYTASNGGGTMYEAGDEITSTVTLYIYDETGTTPNCSDEESFTITINNTPDITDITDKTSCDYYILPEITGSDLSGNEAFYTGINGSGDEYAEGDTIWASTNLFIYDETGTTPNCFDQESFSITIDELADVVLDPAGPACDENTDGITLNGTPSGGTYSGTAVSGNKFYPQNAVIGSNKVIYTVSNGTCSGADTINITVVETPEVDDKDNVTACDFYILPEITGTNLSGEETYIEKSVIGPITYDQGDTIWSTTRLYIYDVTTTNPSCSDEEDFLVTINTTPDVFDLPDTTVCEAYTLPTIPGTNLTLHAGYFTAPNGAGTKYSAGTSISSTTTLYIYDQTDSEPNCWDQEQFTITVTSPLIILDKSDVLCNGSSTGKAWVSVQEGTSPYTYLWNDPLGSTIDTANNLEAGWYTVEITDFYGCTATDSIMVEEPANELSISFDPTKLICFGANNGTATANANGGTSPYSYLWSNGSTTYTASNLTAGTHTVEVWDSNNCYEIDSVTITQYDSLFTEIISQEDISCNGLSNGQVTVQAYGGAGAYSIYIDGTSQGNTHTNPKTFTNLSQGWHVIEVVDYDPAPWAPTPACNSVIDSVYISEPDELEVELIQVDPILCNGQSTASITFTKEGGSEIDSFQWYRFIDYVGFIPLSEDNDTIYNRNEGRYRIRIFDVNGCDASDDITITEPSDLNITITNKTDVDCFGSSDGNATATATGGTPAYTYVWNTVPEQTGSTAIGLAAGTYTVYVTDANGCTDSTNVTIENNAEELVVDVVGTNIVCPGDENGTATANVSGGLAPYAYSWDTNPIQDTKTASGLGTGFYEVTVTDANQCTGSDTITIIQLDTVPPDAICKDFTARLDADGKVVVTVDDVDGGCSDNCADCCDINKYIYPSEFDCSDIGEQFVWLVVSDAAGNKDSCQAKVTVVDEVDPIALCKDTTVYLDENGQFFLEAEDLDDGSYDNCTDVKLEIVPNIMSCEFVNEEETAENVALFVYDDYGNFDVCIADVTVLDTIDPEILCPDDFNIYKDQSCQFVVKDYTNMIVASDNCTIDTITQSVPSGTVIEAETTITFTAYDKAGNSSTCDVVVTPIDEDKPTIICPANQFVSFDKECSFTLPNYKVVADIYESCQSIGGLDTIQVPAPGTVIYDTTEVTLYVSDLSGNGDSCSFWVYPSDNTPPEILCPMGITVECIDEVPDTDSSLTLVVDNCEGDILKEFVEDVWDGNSCPATIVRTYMATDEAGNSNTCTQTITILDTTNPSFTVPADITIYKNDTCGFVASVNVTGDVTDEADNCDVELEASFEDEDITGEECTGKTVILRTWTLEDSCGNDTVQTQTITVLDTTSPTFTVPSDITIYKNDTCGFIATVDITGDVSDEADNCSSELEATFEDEEKEGACADELIIERTWSLTDDCENTTQKVQVITVKDTISPTVSCSAEVDNNLFVNENCEVELPSYIDTASITDNCTDASEIKLYQIPEPGTMLSGSESPIEVWVYAEDACGNIDSCSVNVTLNDTIPPVVECPENDSIPLNENCVVLIPRYSFNTLSDNCTDSTQLIVTQLPLAGTAITENTTVTLYAQDLSGNMESCSFEVIPYAIEFDEISCPSDTTIYVDENCDAAIPELEPEINFASCSEFTNSYTWEQSPSADSIVGVGTYPVTLNVFREQELVQSCTINITVEDNTPPAIACPEDDVVSVDEDCEYTLEDYTSQIEVSDNCTVTEEITLTQVPIAGTLLEGHGTVQTIWIYAEDAYQNIDSCSFTVTLEDNIPPVVACPDDQELPLNEVCEIVIPSFGFVSSSDNCTLTENLEVTQSPIAGTVVTETTQITLTATDEAGNSSSCSFNVIPIITDVTTVVCPDDINADADENCEYVIPELNPVINPASCTELENFTVIQSPVAGTVIGLGNTSVTIEVYEGEELIETCTVNISVEDNSIDVRCPDDVTLEANAQCQVEVPDFTSEIEITENCTAIDDVVVTQSPVAGTLVGLGTTTVTITVSDESGNTANCSVDVTVVDSTNPTIVCPANIELEAQPGICEAEVLIESPVVDDNCEIESIINNFNNTANASGTYPIGETTVVWTVTDASGNTAECEMTVTVIPIPLAVDDQAKTPENTPVDIDILANDQSCDDLDTNTIVIVENPTNGTVTIIPGTGSVTYTPNNGFDGNDEFTYRVCNTSGMCDSAVVTIVIDNTNNPPIAENDINVTDVNTPVNGNVLTNDNDPDGDPISSTKLSDPANGTVTLNPNGTYTYTPDNGFVGTDNFDYVVCDNGGLCDTATVTIEVIVTPPNSVVAVDDNTSGKINTPVTGNVLVNDFDPENDNIIINTTPVSQPANGTLTINSDGTFNYIPNTGFVGIDQFTYRICDDNANQACDEAVVTIDIREIPDTSNTTVAVDDVYNATEGETIDGNVSANDYDPEGDNQISFTVLSGPSNGNLQAFNTATGEFTYVPAEGFRGTDSFTYQVCDDNADQACDIATVILHYFGIDNLPPIAENDINVTDVNTPVNGNVLTNDSDPDGDPISSTKLSDPANGTVTLNPNGTYTYTPDNGFVGTDNFDYVVCDNGGLCDTATVTIEVIVTPPNSVVAVDDNTSGKINTPVTGNVLVNDFDPENDNIIINTTPVSQPANGTLTINSDGTFNYIPNTGFVGIDQFTYRICDDNANQACDEAVVTIDIREIPDTSNTTVAVDDVYNATEGESIDGNVSANDYDPEGDNQISFTVLSGPSNGTLTSFDSNTGEFTYTPNDGFSGTDSYTYQVCDDNADQACDIATVIIHYFAEGNLPPMAENDINSTLIDVPVNGNVLTNDSDPDGDVLTATKLSDPSNGTVTLNSDGTYTYTPGNGYIGEDTFDYIVCDNEGLCDTATVFIAVVDNPILEGNRPPEAIDDNTRGKINTPVTGNLISNDFDPDGDEITINTTPIEAPGTGTLTINSDGTFTFVPENGFTGVVTFQYEICDNGDPVLCDVAEVTIEIEHEEAINTTFASDDMYQSFNVGEAIAGNVSVNDYDPEGHSQSFSLTSNPSNGTLVFNSDGTFEFTPNVEFSGTVSFIYTVCDNGTPQACDIATVYILIEEPLQVLPPDPIIPQDDSYTATCETIYENAILNDDVTLDEITMPTLIEDVKNGTLHFNSDGTFDYTPNEDFIGMDSFTYQICWADADTICGTATVYIDVIYDKACYPCPDLFIPEGFSPNGDGNHDRFVVECIEDLYPEARLIIFNRWGNLIYEKDNYGNTSVWDETEAFWDGKSQHAWTIGDEKVPVGTYMYVLILDSETVRKGTVYINY